MKSLTLDPMPRYDDRAEQELLELLMPKTADAVVNNEEETRHDHAQVYADPPGYKAPDFIRPQFGDAMKDLHNDTRSGVTQRGFSGRGEADRSAQQTIAQNFANGAAGKFTTHSLHLRPKSIDKMAHSPALTLVERLRQLR